MYSNDGRSITLPYLVAGLLALMVYQSVELTWKVNLIRSLHRVEHPESIEYSYVGRDHPAELPLYVPEAAMNAEWPDDELYGLWEDKEWESLFPRGNGWVTLGPNDEMFVLSMYHQLHCLSVLRHAFVAANTSTLVFGPNGNGTGIAHHTNHCLQYLREQVVCKADTTLEESALFVAGDGKTKHGATGMDMVHRCRDWTKIRDHLEANFETRLEKGLVDIYGEETLQE